MPAPPKSQLAGEGFLWNPLCSAASISPAFATHHVCPPAAGGIVVAGGWYVGMPPPCCGGYWYGYGIVVGFVTAGVVAGLVTGDGMVGAVTGFMNGVGVIGVVVVGSGIVTGVGSGYSGGRLGLLEYPVAGLVDGTVTMPGVTGFIAGFVAGTVTGFVAGVVVGLVTGANTSRAVVLAAAASSRRGEGDDTSARTPIHLLPLSASPISLAISAARPLRRNATPTPSSNAAATSATARSAFSSAPISTTTNEPDLLTNSMTLRQFFSPRRRRLFAMARREGSESSGETFTLRPNPAAASSA
uniref:Uncharacterized protein n=1 Tax=Oryza meridionalis TaxID=40149 RepID=A0A0E0D967_9ORYZ